MREGIGSQVSVGQLQAVASLAQSRAVSRSLATMAADIFRLTELLVWMLVSR